MAGTSGSAGTTGTTGTLRFDVESAGLLDGTSAAWEQARDVVVDEMGYLYVVGGTSSPDFPATPGAYDTTYNTGGSELGSAGQTDGFIAKLDPTGAIVWATYLGSPNYDRIYAVEVDAAHDVYVAGRAGNGFPTTAGVLQPTFAGDSAPGAYGSQDGFVAKLSADGSTLLWSTYFGESGPGFVRDLDVDGSNRVHVAASTINGDMAAKVTGDAVQATRKGDFDTFYARLSADATSVEYGTYLGGDDTGGSYSSNPSVRVLPDGTAFVVTIEPGAGAPTTSGAYQTAWAGAADLLLAKFEPSGSLAFCTYLGGNGEDAMDTHSLALDPSGNPVIAALSTSTDYPVTDSSAHAASADVVVSILSADGASLLHSTQMGGNGGDGAEGVSVDAAGNVYVTGSTSSDDLPVTSGALEPTYSGSREGFLFVLSPDLSERRYVSYDGIPGEYANRSSALAPAGNWAIVGAVWNLNPFPATGSNDSLIDGQHGAFFRVLKPR